MARMGRKGFNPTKKLSCAETNAGEAGAVGTDLVVGLKEAFREQSLFGGQRMQQCACRAITKQCTTKAANAARLECCIPAAATCRFRARTDKTEIPTTSSFS